MTEPRFSAPTGSFSGAEFTGDISFKSVSNVGLGGARARRSKSQVWPNGWTTTAANIKRSMRGWVNLVPTDDGRHDQRKDGAE